MAKVRAGHPALRKALRRFPCVTLKGSGQGGHALVYVDGKLLRLPDGRPFSITSTPSNGDIAAKVLVERLLDLGVVPRR